jgi:hypothetical protein
MPNSAQIFMPNKSQSDTGYHLNKGLLGAAAARGGVIFRPPRRAHSKTFLNLSYSGAGRLYLHGRYLAAINDKVPHFRGLKNTDTDVGLVTGAFCASRARLSHLAGPGASDLADA